MFASMGKWVWARMAATAAELGVYRWGRWWWQDNASRLGRKREKETEEEEEDPWESEGGTLEVEEREREGGKAFLRMEIDDFLVDWQWGTFAQKMERRHVFFLPYFLHLKKGSLLSRPGSTLHPRWERGGNKECIELRNTTYYAVAQTKATTTSKKSSPLNSHQSHLAPPPTFACLRQIIHSLLFFLHLSLLPPPSDASRKCASNHTLMERSDFSFSLSLFC